MGREQAPDPEDGDPLGGEQHEEHHSRGSRQAGVGGDPVLGAGTIPLTDLLGACTDSADRLAHPGDATCLP